jgi:hypothetical protein
VIFARSIEMNVMFVTLEVRTDDRPAMMLRVARVTMNEGRPVRTTISPLIAPSPVERAIAMRIDSQIGRPQIVTQMPIMIPAKPTIEPTDRSNSPAIIRRATAVAMIPTCDATPTKFSAPGIVRKARLPRTTDRIAKTM